MRAQQVVRFGHIGAQPLPEHRSPHNQIRVVQTVRTGGRKIRASQAFHAGHAHYHQQQKKAYAREPHQPARDEQRHLPHAKRKAQRVIGQRIAAQA